MKVKDLIVALASCDPDGEVIIRHPAAVRVGEYTDFEVDDTEYDSETSAPFHSTLMLVTGNLYKAGRWEPMQ